MKAIQEKCRRPASGTAQLTFLIGLVLMFGCLPGVRAQSVPERLNYQGLLLDGQGAPVVDPTDVEFRIWDTATGTDLGGLKWGRMFRITPDTNGAFNVVLSDEGGELADATNTVTLDSVFTGTGSDARYLELMVKDSTPIRPRQQFVASPYAFLANGLTDAARQNFTVSSTLSVAGAANISSASVGTLTASGAANVGTLTATGAVTAASFSGSGAGLTNINTNNLVQQVVEALCPPGTIVAFGGTAVPSGWLLCDGTTVSRTSYQRLFASIGTAWGSGNGSSTFHLPDLRGMFLRGVNGNRTDTFADPDSASRTSSATGANVKNAVGSVQTDSLQSHSHLIDFSNHVSGGEGDEGKVVSGDQYPGQVIQAFDTQPYGGSETRPNNAYVNYIIKY